uniref:Uncharacterized protein n=1 Tax=Arundo donax TaxID=35708 RepID=A0A0A9BRJ0_ARUDO
MFQKLDAQSYFLCTHNESTDLFSTQKLKRLSRKQEIKIKIFFLTIPKLNFRIKIYRINNKDYRDARQAPLLYMSNYSWGSGWACEHQCGTIQHVAAYLNRHPL